MNAESQERAKAAAAAAVSSLEARQRVPIVTTGPSPPPAALAPTSQLIADQESQQLTSPMIQPLELPPDNGLEPLLEDAAAAGEGESLENVVIPVLPDHLPDFQMPKVGVCVCVCVCVCARERIRVYFVFQNCLTVREQ
jgi:hypothetical protein